jgi:LysR family transcriptional activator of nhaA
MKLKSLRLCSAYADSRFQARSLHPNVVGEFDDRALAKKFGGRGAGVFIGPTVLSAEIGLRYGARVLGVADELEDESFAISIERRIRHPCVIAITESARNDLLAASTRARPARKAH